jgi:hypothetical protein
MQAVALNSGKESGNQAMARLRHELGDDIAEHIGSHHQRMERTTIVRDLLDDENTFLYQQGRHDILRQTMEDGSSVACTRCNDVMLYSRWNSTGAWRSRMMQVSMMIRHERNSVTRHLFCSCTLTQYESSDLSCS